MMAEGWLSFPLFILHPCMDLSLSDAGRKRLASPPPVLLHEVTALVSFSVQNRSMQQIHRSAELSMLTITLARERTIPTERLPLVGEVSANFCGLEGVAWSAQKIPTAVISYF
jgi:hypothetical protein